jgi:protein phosphatase methylesterase 1
METYLYTRPTSFPSLAAGIEWHTRSRTIRNLTSARVSVPSLLVETPDSTSPTTTTTNSSQRQSWTWRTDLSATKPFWENWFVGLSAKFLEARGGKLLLLAGTDRLDKELMIGQMQGICLLHQDPSYSFLGIDTCCPFQSSTTKKRNWGGLD